MLRKLIAVLTAAVSLTAFAVLPAAADGPNFEPGLYADGQVFSSKGTAELPEPTEANRHSYDDLYVITNGVDEQLPVAEAAPGEQDFNGGRWATHTVTWNDPADAVLLTSDDDVHYFEGEGLLTITHGSPEGGPPAYFQCPLLPVKG